MAQALGRVPGAGDDPGPDIDRFVAEHFGHFLLAQCLAGTVGPAINRIGFICRIVHHGIRRGKFIAADTQRIAIGRDTGNKQEIQEIP